MNSSLATSPSVSPSTCPTTDHRRNVYYWKCDRPSILENRCPRSSRPREDLLERLTAVIGKTLGESRIKLEPGVGQGNHLTFTGHAGGNDFFIRVEDGPEGDSFMDIETAIICKAREKGVPVPRVFAVDATREKVPFAWQILEKIPGKDLASFDKTQPLAEMELAATIGVEVAKWQSVKVENYGPFSINAWREHGILQGLHRRYPDYFFLQLPRHLKILRDGELITPSVSDEINLLFRKHEDLLHLDNSCLVYKDLAFWNILGEPGKIHAFIDWEDAIGGDPMDDLSLLGCFHSGLFVTAP